jgi:hypothetical protein
MSTPNAPQKMFLFFSNYCEHSKRLLNRLKSSNLINNFNMVSIDDPNINIPNFIESVPSMYDPVQRQVMNNETLFNWVESVLSNQNSSNNSDVVNMEDITGSSDILAFQQTEMVGGAGGTAYSFIDDNDNDSLNHHYEYLDNRDNNNLVKFTKASENSSLNNSGNNQTKTGGAITSAYDKMMADRQQEMQSSLPAMRL